MEHRLERDDITIRPLAADDEADTCARMMADTDPWQALGRDVTACRRVVSPQHGREIYVAISKATGDLVGVIVISLTGVFVGYIQTLRELSATRPTIRRTVLPKNRTGFRSSRHRPRHSGRDLQGIQRLFHAGQRLFRDPAAVFHGRLVSLTAIQSAAKRSNARFSLCQNSINRVLCMSRIRLHSGETSTQFRAGIFIRSPQKRPLRIFTYKIRIKR